MKRQIKKEEFEVHLCKSIQDVSRGCGRPGLFTLLTLGLLLPTASASASAPARYDVNLVSSFSVQSVVGHQSFLVGAPQPAAWGGAEPWNSASSGRDSLQFGNSLGNSTALWAAQLADAEWSNACGLHVLRAENALSSACGAAELLAAAESALREHLGTWKPWLQIQWNKRHDWTSQFGHVSEFTNLEIQNMDGPFLFGGCLCFLLAVYFLSWRDVGIFVSVTGWLLLWIPNPWAPQEPFCNLVWLIAVYFGTCISQWNVPSSDSCVGQRNENGLHSAAWLGKLVWSLSLRDVAALFCLAGWLLLIIPNSWCPQDPRLRILWMASVYLFAGFGLGPENSSDDSENKHQSQALKRSVSLAVSLCNSARELSGRDLAALSCLVGWLLLISPNNWGPQDPLLRLICLICVYVLASLGHGTKGSAVACRIKRPKRKRKQNEKLHVGNGSHIKGTKVRTWNAKKMFATLKIGKRRIKFRHFAYRFRFRLRIWNLKKGRHLRLTPRDRQAAQFVPLPFFFPGPFYSDSCENGHNSGKKERWATENAAYLQALHAIDLSGGKGASAATNRKRKESESSLAEALSGFLQSWSLNNEGQGPQEDTGKGKGKKAGKGRGKSKGKSKSEDAMPPSTSTETQLAKKLLNTLKVCLNKGASDQEVVSLVLQQLGQGGLADSKHSQPPTPSSRTVFLSSGHATKNGKGKGVPQTKTPKNDLLPAATSLRAAEWTTKPILISFGKMQEMLRKGEAFSCNMIEIRSLDEFQQFKTLWQAFENPGSVTALLTGQASHVTEATATKKTIYRGQRGPQVEPVAIKTFGSNVAQCPWSAPVNEIAKDNLPKVSKVTVRIMAPEAYRRIFLQEEKHDSPAQIIASASQEAQVPVAALTGGRWEKQQFGSKSQFTGHVRVSTDVASKLLKCSGALGVFFAKVSEPSDSSDKPRVFWIRKLETENAEFYYRRVRALGTSRKQPLLLRRGGGSDLGFLFQEGDKSENRPQVFDMWGFPKDWDEEDVLTLLKNLKWVSPSVLSKRRFQQQWSWRVRASPPPGNSEKSSWIYRIADDMPWSLEVLLAPPRPSKFTSQTVQGPPKKFGNVTLGDFLQTAKETSANQPSEDRRTRGRANQAAAEQEARAKQRGRSRTPTRKDAKDTVHAEKSEETAKASDNAAMEVDDQVAATQIDPVEQNHRDPIDPTDATQNMSWVLQDWKGNGDCGFRAIADGWADTTAREKWTEADAKREAAWIRSQCIAHIRKHQERYKKFELASSINSFDDFVQKAGENTFWINGMLLQSASEKLGAPIVVWRATEAGGWKRFCVAAKFSKGHACKAKDVQPIVIVLENKHFRALRCPAEASVPKAWLRESSRDVQSELIDLTGGGSGAAPDLSPGKASVVSFATPSVHSFVSSHAASVVPPSSASRAPLPGGGLPAVSVTGRTSQSRAGSAVSSSSRAAASVATPSVHSLPGSGVGRAEPHTPSVHTLVSGLTLGTLQASLIPWEPSARVGLRRRLCGKQYVPPEVKRHVWGSLEKEEWKPGQASSSAANVGDESFVWTCSRCDSVFTADTKKKLLIKRQNHCKCRHGGVLLAVDRPFKPPVQIVEASSDLPENGRSWNCAFCNAGLPDLPKHQKAKSIAHHYATKHPRRKKDFATKGKARSQRRRKLGKAGPKHPAAVAINAAVRDLSRGGAQAHFVETPSPLLSGQQAGLFQIHLY